MCATTRCKSFCGHDGEIRNTSRVGGDGSRRSFDSPARLPADSTRKPMHEKPIYLAAKRNTLPLLPVRYFASSIPTEGKSRMLASCAAMSAGRLERTTSRMEERSADDGTRLWSKRSNPMLEMSKTASALILRPGQRGDFRHFSKTTVHRAVRICRGAGALRSRDDIQARSPSS